MRTVFTRTLPLAGIKKGVVHGATDELGFHTVENPHDVTDIHATVLHLMGLDGRRLGSPGRKRLEIDHGALIREIMAERSQGFTSRRGGGNRGSSST